MALVGPLWSARLKTPAQIVKLAAIRNRPDQGIQWS